MIPVKFCAMKNVLIYLAVLLGFNLFVALLGWLTMPIGGLIAMAPRPLGTLGDGENAMALPVAAVTFVQAAAVTVMAVWCTSWFLKNFGLVLDWGLLLFLLVLSLVND